MKQRSLAAIFILGVLLASSIVLSLSNAESSALEDTEEDKERLRAENILKLVYSTRNKANGILDFAATYLANETFVEETELNYTVGEQMLSIANATLYEEEPAPEETWGNYTLAINLSLEAMHQFKVSISNVVGHWEEPGQSAGWRLLAESIQRSEDYIVKVTTLLEEIKNNNYSSYNFTLIEGELGEANQHLAQARGNMTALKVNMTVREIDMARQSLGKINVEVKKMGEFIPVQVKRINLFIDEPMKKLIQDVEALSAIFRKNLSEQVSAVKAKVSEAETLIDSGDLKGAMSAVQEAHRMLMELANEVYMKNSPPI